MTEVPQDLLFRQLAQLPRIAPDAARAERVRAQCRAALDRRQRRQLGAQWSLQMLLASAAILFYAVATATNALHLLGAP